MIGKERACRGRLGNCRLDVSVFSIVNVFFAGSMQCFLVWIFLLRCVAVK
jgi:hypothetical protein